MISSPVPPPTDAASRVGRVASASSGRFAGKHVAMVTFSPYPHDPRPSRAVDALVGEGATVDLICLGDDGAPRQEDLKGIKVFRVRLKNPRRGKLEYGCRYGAFILISSVIFVWRTLLRRYDLVYVHNMPDILVLCSLFPKALGAKVVLDLHDPMPELMKAIFHAPEESGSVQLLKRLEKWSIGQADLAIAVNVACQRIFSSRSCEVEKIAVVMNSPDGKVFRFRAAQADSRRSCDGQRPFVIMYHGSLVERNGLDVAIDALARVRQSVPTAELRIFGPSTAFQERVMEGVRKKNLDGMVHYLGPRRLEDLVTEIGDCDLGVIPNHRNAFTEINTPTRIFEYLALGKPVVAPSTPGIQDYFSKESLLFFEPGNSSDLARQIEYAFSHPREVLDIVRKGQKVYQEHTWEQERQTLLGRLGEILNGNREHPCGPHAQAALADQPDRLEAFAMPDNHLSRLLPYVLITPARNEEAFIEKTIESMTHQTHLPLKWVIVDDGSTDGTAQIVSRYLPEYSWIELVQMPQRRDRSFAAKVGAFNAGYEKVKGLPYEIIGNLDADISFESDHFEFLAGKFSEDPTLGVAGTVFREEGYNSEKDSFEGHKHVSGQCQLFRRQCWEEIGGYIPHRAGGIDWMAVTTARMMGWKTNSFREKWFFHYRHLGTAERSVLSSLFSYGEKDYYLGGHPVWEIFRVAFRATKNPYIVGGLSLGMGYCWAIVRRTPRPVSRELMAFHRKEQMNKLKTILKSLVRFREVDSFDVGRS